jgi:hypothetical protein
MEERLMQWRQQKVVGPASRPATTGFKSLQSPKMDIAAKRSTDQAENNYTEPKKRKTEVKLAKAAIAAKMQRSASMAQEAPSEAKEALPKKRETREPLSRDSEQLKLVHEKLDILLRHNSVIDLFYACYSRILL